MVGIAEIAGGLSSLKAAKDIVQGLNAAATQATVNEVKIDLQSLILEAQQALFTAQTNEAALAGRIGQLEQEIVRLKDWSGQRERYHLVNVDRGSFAYMPKPGMENGEPAHWLCTSCFDQGRKSFLQFKGQGSASGSRSDESIYGCNTCKGSLKVFWRRKPLYPGEAEKLEQV